ncbi:hypothetical protein IB267_32870 [Ensifer sp. ENS09]|uniref:hypothetical protein n=1 Tax=Ensifer sp. ENS09 TaxID=2769263 RepID=UPI00177FE9E1|nr:hypothetical protein [Ensifer sp. ENS09]MBD9653158.1 hypothetical protein [Ensifer sp. ENS09]
MKKSMSPVSTIPSPLLTQLDSRDVALWLQDSGAEELDLAGIEAATRLPWNMVVSEMSEATYLSALEQPEEINDPLVRRRGLIQIVDSDPAESLLPPRHLAVMLLNGRGTQRKGGFGAMARRMAMLQELRKSPLKQLVVASTGPFEVPPDLIEMWADGFRTALTFVSDDPDAQEKIKQWQREFAAPFVGLIALSASDFGQQLATSYLRGRDGAVLVRVRNDVGDMRLIDVGALDDPERPILSSFDLIGSQALSPLMPGDLSADEVDGFFADPSASWRPYAAGMPWERDRAAWEKIRGKLRELDKKGPEENRIFYVNAESGSGATVFIRDLAWRAADEGYPTLVARSRQVSTTGLEMTNFLTRLVNTDRDQGDSPRYEVPCLLVFDQIHWDGREAELLSFSREIERSGRRACIIVVNGPYTSLSMLAERKFVSLASLSHRISSSQALELGRHLNKFLVPHGTSRNDNDWRDFYNSSSVRVGDEIAAFWIVLSFWLQRQLNLGETVQSRVYKQFQNLVADQAVKTSILRIAAFSTVRIPLPDALLAQTADWPTSDKLEDVRRDAGALGLVRVASELDRFWAMAHDLLGRYLLTALFYDTAARESYGLESAKNPEHVRFLLLRQISALPILKLASLRDVADSFAVSIFKIDPDHGHGSLAAFWPEVLEALDEMHRSIRTTSRTFLHHCSISRRRIASDRLMFAMSDGERVDLLQRAVDDLQAALELEAHGGGETDLGLYNSLAHALHDLAEAQGKAGLSASTIENTRAQANEATQRAYSANPDNSFTVETYARSLLMEGQADRSLALVKALEVLALAYSLLERPGFEPRKAAHMRLAEKAFELLLSSKGEATVDPDSETGAIAIAVAALVHGIGLLQGIELEMIPKDNRIKAAELLAAAPIAGNVQAVKLRYLLTVLDRPLDFDLQLELLQSLQGSGPAFTPQLELDLAVLMFQQNRAFEGDRAFRKLRMLWRRGEHYVEVPPRLHWLLDVTRQDRRQVRARVAPGTEGRAYARVVDFQNIEVPFRPGEYSIDQRRPGAMLSGYISFGHNGPLLRPLTAPRR